jgi:hypothetical protein
MVKQRWILRPAKWSALERGFWKNSSGNTVTTIEAWKWAEFVVVFHTLDIEGKVGPMKKLLKDCVRIDDTYDGKAMWKLEPGIIDDFYWFFEEEYGLPEVVYDHASDGGTEIESFSNPDDEKEYDRMMAEASERGDYLSVENALEDLGYWLEESEWQTNGAVYIIADNVPEASYSRFKSESKSLGLSRKDITLLSIGAITGIVAGIIGEFVSELLVDRLRKVPQLETTDDENAV